MNIHRLTEGDRPEIRRLVERCDEAEGLELPIDPEGDGLIWRDDRAIVGYVGIEPGPSLETTGMVHPAYRRRGIGRALLHALQEYCRQADVVQCDVVLDEASPSGRAFMAAVGGRYHMAEYRMALDRAAFPGAGTWPDSLDLRPVGLDSLSLFSSLVDRAFGEAEGTARGWLVTDMQRPNRRYWIAYHAGEPIGTVRVIGPGREVYITALGVLPEYRGRGFGRQILARTAAALLADDWDAVLIEVETENSNALGLYRSVGFQEIRTYGFYDIPLTVPALT